MRRENYIHETVTDAFYRRPLFNIRIRLLSSRNWGLIIDYKTNLIRTAECALDALELLKMYEEMLNGLKAMKKIDIKLIQYPIDNKSGEKQVEPPVNLDIDPFFFNEA
ncbi:hypothetical protein TSAR_003671 [Trichomalopsis sarcophagae]|uniref:Uncharacterized protein n=1 Tax=Trichomalopsis sarcophagae TaxID=543379 RepID=A0A232ETZ5_9HYME|nr:hypothetical protein TSAR_003671 [Trichomalopsis sarcophagae]